MTTKGSPSIRNLRLNFIPYFSWLQVPSLFSAPTHLGYSTLTAIQGKVRVLSSQEFWSVCHLTPLTSHGDLHFNFTLGITPVCSIVWQMLQTGVILQHLWNALHQNWIIAYHCSANTSPARLILLFWYPWPTAMEKEGVDKCWRTPSTPTQDRQLLLSLWRCALIPCFQSLAAVEPGRLKRDTRNRVNRCLAIG